MGNRTIAVYDLGGGTFDISIIEIDEVDGEKPLKFWRPTVIPTGGEDFDTRLINYLVDEFKKDQGIDLRNDPLAMQRLKEAAEKRRLNCLLLSRPTLTCRTSLQTRPVRNT